MIVLVANKATFKYDSSELINLFRRMQYLSYLITIICLSIIFHLLYLYSTKHNGAIPIQNTNHVILSDSEQPQQPTKRARSSQAQFIDEDESSSDANHSKFHLFLTSEKSKILIPSFYALVSAMIGSQSVVLAKSSSLLITESVESDSQFDDPITYVFLVSWGVAMLFWLYRMNYALRSYNGAFIIPIFQVLWMLFSMLSGGILFREFDGYRWYNYVGLIVAAIVIFCGVYQLSPHENEQEVLNTLASNSRESIIRSASLASSANISLCIGDAADPMPKRDEFIDPNKVVEIFNNLRDDEDLKSSLVPTPQNEEVVRSSTLDLPANSRSLRTLQRFFETSGRMLSDLWLMQASLCDDVVCVVFFYAMQNYESDWNRWPIAFGWTCVFIIHKIGE